MRNLFTTKKIDGVINYDVNSVMKLVVLEQLSDCYLLLTKSKLYIFDMDYTKIKDKHFEIYIFR